MTEPGDIYVADLNEELSRRVLVASARRFNETAGRALVVPEILGPPDEVPFPWRVECDGAVFAVDFVRTIPVDRLLERTGRASGSAMARVRRAVLHING